MAKPEREPILIRQSFSHARRRAVVVERLRDATRGSDRAIERPSLNCPTCGVRMRLVRRAPTIGAPAALVATCARCTGRSED